MAQLNFRRAAVAGVAMSFALAAASIGWSTDQPRAAAELLATGVLATLVALLVIRAIAGRSSR